MSEIIETYWNVNVAQLKCMLTSKSEIIETYWNVNEGMEEYIKSVAKGNNRNILECKSAYSSSSSSSSQSK